MAKAQQAPRIYLRGGVYWADLRSADGKRRRVSTGETDERAAQRAAERLAVEHRTPARSTSMTLRDALEFTYKSHWSRTRSATILRRVLDVIERQVGHLALAEVTFKRLEAYAQGLLQDGLAPATVNRRMSCISTALGGCVRRGELPARPEIPHYREANVTERYMKPEEETKVFEVLTKKAKAGEIMGDHDGTYLLHLIGFLLDTGFRFSEAFKFQLVDGHADLKHGETKNGAGRRVPLTKRALAAAKYMLASKPGFSRHAVLQQSEGKAPWDWVAHRWQKVTTAAGCPDVNLHALRHTCASRLVQKGVPIYTVSKWLGHSSVKVTERYAKLAPNSLDGALAALEG